MEKELKVSDKLSVIIKIIIIISFCFLNCIIFNTQKYDSYIKIFILNIILTFIIVAYVLFRKIKITNINKIYYSIALFLGTYFVICFKEYSMIITKTPLFYLVSFLSIPAISFVFYYLIDKGISFTKKISKTLTKLDKKYLIIGLIISTVLAITTISMTQVFTTSSQHQNPVDVLFTSDSSTLLNNNAYFNFNCRENDIRQPLFGIMALPVSLVSLIISDILFFIPFNYIYPLLITIFQFLLSIISIILLGKIIEVTEDKKIYFYLLFSLSLPFLLMNLIIEQYAICTFYLILTIFYYKTQNKVNYIYIPAVGTLLTSSILFPLIKKTKNIKEYLKSTIKCLFAFISIIIVSGRITYIQTAYSQTTDLLTKFALKLPFKDKIYRFTYFVSDIFLPRLGKEITNYKAYKEYVSIIPTNISLIGIILLLIVTISFILNRKKLSAKISYLWIIFSYVVLCLVGWGTIENGLIIYSLYFAWAYYTLIYLLISKINNKKLFNIIMIIFILIIFINNIHFLMDIMKFGIKYYPR